MRGDELRSIVDRVTSYTIANQVERMTWQKSVALSGLLRWGEQRGVDAARRWLVRAVDTQNSRGLLNYSDKEIYAHGHSDSSITDSGILALSLAYPLLQLHQIEPDRRYMEAAQLQVDAAMRAPRTKDGGFWSRLEGPELWIDFLYLSMPPLALFGRLASKPQYIDEAFNQFEVHVKHLVDPQHHLGRHVWREIPNCYPESTFWSRGNGWMITCCVELLTLAEKHPKREFVVETTRNVLKAIAALQDRSGFLHDTLDDPSTRMEASGTVMYAYAVARAVKLGVVDVSMLESAVRALRVVAGSVTEDGAVPGVSIPPGGPTAPLGVAMYGQGFFLMAAYELQDKFK